jgi:hypothetical protein
MFELVLDYGEGHYADLTPDSEGRQFVAAHRDTSPDEQWTARPDPFSTYRAGFEVRTHRLCQRALMFHHFPQELGEGDCLVAALQLQYESGPVASFLIAVTQSGYVRQPGQASNHYLKKSLPPGEFTYSKMPDAAQLNQLPVQYVAAESLDNLPFGLDGSFYQWVDLDGEGLSGILTEQANAWFYKRNLSPLNERVQNGETRISAQLSPVEIVPVLPNASLTQGKAQFADLAGDGLPDLVTFAGPVPGFYEHDAGAGWQPFHLFSSQPNINLRDPNLRLVDLTGDGHADILITDGDALCWHPSLSESGFGPAIRVSVPFDEGRGPRIIFADGTQSIYLADMSGDGLSDLVRIRNGDVCYWPNLGYGHFGPRVMMDNAPRFDTSNEFDQSRIRLADIDGSGVTDILYLGRDGVCLYKRVRQWLECARQASPISSH